MFHCSGGGNTDVDNQRNAGGGSGGQGGVPADHRKFVVVLHQEGTDLSLNNAAYKALKDGHDNPNIPLIHSMKQAGVDFRVCGQGVLSRKFDMATINPEIQIDQWAMTTITTLQLRGYVRVQLN